MASRAATPVRLSRNRFIWRCKSARNDKRRTRRNPWPADKRMFEAHLNERQSRVDWQMIAAIVGLMVIGVAFIYSAKPPSETTAWYNQFYVRQIIWYGVGTVAALSVCLIDYHSLAPWALVAYWAAVLL